MTRRPRTALIGGALIAALLLVGAGFPTKKVPPEQWATGVCTALNDWVSAANAGAADLGAALTGTDPKLRDVRELLVAYLGDTTHATTLMIDDLDAAETPDTPKGTKAAKGLTAGFKKIRTSLRKLQHQAEDISIKKRARALRQIKALNRRVTKEFDTFQATLEKLNRLDPGRQLETAFQSAPECQTLMDNITPPDSRSSPA